MKSESKKNIWIHVGIIALFFAVACAYFSPILSGQALPQGDIQKYECMAKAQKDYHNATGEYSTWAPSMFSGMPGYQITNSPQHSVFQPLRRLSTLSFVGWENTIGAFFLYLVGFYVALVALGISPLLALLGALAFGLGSYNIIIIEAGHISKAWALAMMVPVLAAMILTFRKKYVWGGILFTLALGLQITFNHIQITFYTAIGGVILGLVYFAFSVRRKELKPFLLGVAVLLVGVMLALACNVRHLFVNQEYMAYTMRGGKEITVTPKDLNPDAPATDNGTSSKGLDINYAFSWSYGIGETYTLLVPGAMGGGSGERVDNDSEFYKNFRQNQAPLYWGDQPFTSGPVYFGAIVVFLFILGLFVVKGPDRWWIVIATLLAVLMSWGRNFMGLNEFLFNNLPLYNKFRTPSMSLTLANALMVLMGVLTLKRIVDAKQNGKSAASLNSALYTATGITVGILVIGIIVAGKLSYSGSADLQMESQYKDNPQLLQMLQSALRQDRESLFLSDSWRSLLFVVLAAASLWLFINDKLKKSGIVIATLAALTVIDLWGVDRRYLNTDSFADERKTRINPEQYDLELDQQAVRFGDVNYRVMDLATDTYNDSKPSAFHNQIGGYSAAKLRRYQDLIDFYLNQNAVVGHYYASAKEGGMPSFDNYAVLDMLNCRYMILPAQNGPQVMRRNSALGNVWFVREAQIVDDANAEILALNDFDPATTAIVNKEFADALNGWKGDSTASSIEMVPESPVNPSHCIYNAHCEKDELAVFSEIYYAPDWKAYIDGKPAEYFRADYVLRAMVIPAGNHQIEFRNEAPTMHRLDNWTLIFSIFTVLVIAGALVLHYRKPKEATKK